MENTEQVHSSYRPGKECIPITPQARQFGYVFPVYVTQCVWADAITWAYQKGRETNTDARIFDLLRSAYDGMGKNMATEPDRIMYTFKHWCWDRLRPKAKKQTKRKYGARLFLDPETKEPWLLIFDPQRNGNEVLEAKEDE
jgi:hypothetical protein